MNAQDVFYEKIQKSAALTPALARAARWLADSPARTALVGAGAGALGGAVTHDPHESALSGALRGGLLGAGVGAVGGGLGRGYVDTRLLRPELTRGQAVKATAKRVGEGVARFGKRQLHGFTGAGVPEEIGLASRREAQRRINLLKLRKEDLKKRGLLSANVRDSLAEKVRDLRSWGQEGDAAIRAGITSIPGVAKGLATKPLSTVKSLGKAVAGGTGLTSGAIALGLPTALSAPDLMRGDESATGGRSTKQKLVGLGATLAGGAATAGLPILPQLVGGEAIEGVARRAMRRKKRSRLEAEEGL